MVCTASLRSLKASSRALKSRMSSSRSTRFVDWERRGPERTEEGGTGMHACKRMQIRGGSFGKCGFCLGNPSASTIFNTS